MNDKKKYVSPEVTVLGIAIEEGIAVSPYGNTNEPGNPIDHTYEYEL